MAKKNEGVTPQQAQVIALIVAGTTQTEAAAVVGITPETISRWKGGDAHFIAALTDAQQTKWLAGTAKLEDLAADALAALGELLQDEDPKIKLQAVKVWLDNRPAPPMGSTNPETIAGELRQEARMNALSPF